MSEIYIQIKRSRVSRALSRDFNIYYIIMIMCFLYMIKNSTEKLYVGISKNPQDRTKYHNLKRGAKFTKYISNFQIVFLEEYDVFSEARKREIQIKKWSRKKKDFLIDKYKDGLETKI